MKKMNLRAVSVAALATWALSVGLSGCGSDKKTEAVVTPPTPVAVVKLEDGFGSGFGTAYRVTPNTEPNKPATTDINGVSLTTEPTALH